MRKTLCLSIVALLFINILAAQSRFTLDDILDGKFAQKNVAGFSSLKDGKTFLKKDGKGILSKYSFETGEKLETFVDLSKLRNSPIEDFQKYTLSDDETKIMFAVNINKIYRRSYTAENYIWNFVSQEWTKLSENGAQEVATFSPDGTKIAFVRDNNVFIKNLRFNSEVQVTSDGKKNEIINGKGDWEYEEEFSLSNAMSWSPDSKYLSYIKFNEKDVQAYSLRMYKGLLPEIVENELYPQNIYYKYPKAGEKNSIVSAHVYELMEKNTIKVKIPEGDNYIPRCFWSPDAKNAAFMEMNRFQNELNIYYANPLTGDVKVLHRETNKRYISEDFLDNLHFINEGKEYVTLTEKDGWSHLYLYDANGTEKACLTKGDYDVTKFYGYNAATKTFYYQAAKKTPMQREIYSLTQTKKGRVEKLLTTQNGTNNAEFSADFSYYVLKHTSLNEPLNVSVYSIDGEKLRTLEDNKELIDRIAEANLPQREFFSFKNSEGTMLNGWMMKPTDFDPNITYPVLMTQYSGPNSQSATDSWSANWTTYMAAQGYIVSCVDPRGTAARGEEFRKCTYKQLGVLESSDHIDAAKYLASLPYVDSKKITMYGWSYGGYMTALSLCRAADIINTGVAVAPVTSWRYYDAIYTERYMQTPQANKQGYKNSSVANYADGLTGNLILIHGLADDNVHPQNTFELAEVITQKNKNFDMHTYTNRNHSIYGGNTRKHLFNKIIKYINESMK
ncbi:MAG: S9 family peptidase [Bacteroidales bacterium]